MTKSADPMTDLETFLDALADRIAARVADRLLAGDTPGVVDQHSSPLGRRKHIAAIRSGELRGRQVGRRWLASAEDVQAFISHSDAEPKEPKRPKDETPEDIARRLGIDLHAA